METMYDRLGDLLNETLETGHVKYVHVKPENQHDKKDKDNSYNSVDEKLTSDEKVTSEEKRSVYKKNDRRVHFKVPVTKEILAAYKLLNITTSATLEEIKAAYKERLKYFHPDRHGANAVLQKVATDKTKAVVAAYRLIMNSIDTER